MADERRGTSPTPTGPPRWAPFPIQDWDAYQTTEQWRAYAAAQSGPGGSTPARRLRPVLVLALCCVLVAGIFLLADQRPAPGTSRFVPADGAAAGVLLDLGSGSPVPATREDAVLPWRQTALTVDAPLGDLVLDVAGVRSGLLWRQLVQPDDPDRAPMLWLLSVAGGDVTLVAERQPGEAGQVFDPGIRLVLPGMGDGDAWVDSGTVRRPDRTGTAGRYSARLTATPAGECVGVHGHLALTGQGGQAVREERRWRLCPQAGITEYARGAGPTATGYTPDASGPPPRGSGTTPSAETFGDAPSGAPRPAPVSAIPGGATSASGTGTGGTTVMGTPGRFDPVAAPGHRIVRLATTGQDVVVLTTADDRLAVQRRLHPGATVLTATVIGRTVLAGTSDRALVAWSDSGVRLWSRRLDDTLTSAPVRIDDDTALTVTISGRVSAWDLATGHRRWTRTVSSGATTMPAVGAGVVAVATRSGTLTVLEADSGRPRWTVDTDPVSALVVSDGRLVAAASGYLVSYDLAGGARRWLTRIDTITTAVTATAAGYLVTGPHHLRLVDPSGALVWRRSGCDGLTVSPAWSVCWSAGLVAVLDTATGERRGVLELPDLLGDPVPMLLGDRLWLFDSAAWSTWYWEVPR